MSRGLSLKLAGALLALSLSLASCSEDEVPLTQIVVVVDSDFSGLTRFEAKIEGFEEPSTVRADLEDTPLPRQFSLVHDGGPLGPMAVTVSAYTDGDEPILVEHRTGMFFQAGRTLLLKVDLLAACVALHCDEACVAPGECVSSDEAAVLIPWSGDPDDLDVGGPLEDAGMDSGVMPMPDAMVEDTGTVDTGTDAELPPLDADVPDDAADGDDAGDATTVEPDAEVDAGQDAMMPEPTWPYVPSNVDVEDGTLTGLTRSDIVLDCGDTTIDSTTPSVTGFCNGDPDFVVYDQPGAGGEVLIVVMSSLQIDAASTLHLTGSRPIVLLVEGDATIAGAIDASASGTVGGPGAIDATCAGSIGAPGTTAPSSGLYGASGGGGGGFGTGGTASGGSGSTNSVAGGLFGGEPTLSPLRGGCRGGAGGAGKATVVTAAPGAGGGAMQLSIAGTLTLTGTLRAAGGGGAPGSGNQGGGGGGGSGGAILIEAETLAIDSGAVIAANGGGGGGGQQSGTLDGTPGEGGLASTMPANGGTGSGTSGGDGGDGASFGNMPTDGGNGVLGGTCFPVQVNCHYGGGGGGAGGLGRIRIRGATSCDQTATFSPSPSVECESCGACLMSPDPSCTLAESGATQYLFCSSAVDWEAARSLCQSVQLELAKIDSSPENDFLFTTIDGNETWIGAYDLDDNDDWRWSADDSAFWSGDEGGDPVGGAFEDWRTGEPNDTGDCARMTPDGWADTDCGDPYAFICEP